MQLALHATPELAAGDEDRSYLTSLLDASAYRRSRRRRPCVEAAARLADRCARSSHDLGMPTEDLVRLCAAEQLCPDDADARISRARRHRIMTAYHRSPAPHATMTTPARDLTASALAVAASVSITHRVSMPSSARNQTAEHLATALVDDTTRPRRDLATSRHGCSATASHSAVERHAPALRPISIGTGSTIARQRKLTLGIRNGSAHRSWSRAMKRLRACGSVARAQMACSRCSSRGCSMPRRLADVFPIAVDTAEEMIGLQSGYDR